MSDRLDCVSAKLLNSCLEMVTIDVDNNFDQSDESDLDDMLEMEDSIVAVLVYHEIAGNRPPDTFDRLPMFAPWSELEPHDFFDRCRFHPPELFELAACFTLVNLDHSGNITGRYGTKVSISPCLAHCSCAISESKNMVFLFRELRMQRSWLHAVCFGCIDQLNLYYRRLVSRISRFRVLPHL